MVVSKNKLFLNFNYAQYSAVMLLLISFMLPVLAAPSIFNSQIPDTIYGWKAFISGLIQLIFVSGLVIHQTINSVISFNLSGLVSVFEAVLVGIPVLANFTFICCLVHSHRNNNRNATYLALITTSLMLIFILHHQAFIGPDISMTLIEPLFGAYVWTASGFVLFLSCLLSKQRVG